MRANCIRVRNMVSWLANACVSYAAKLSPIGSLEEEEFHESHTVLSASVLARDTTSFPCAYTYLLALPSKIPFPVCVNPNFLPPPPPLARCTTAVHSKSLTCNYCDNTNFNSFVDIFSKDDNNNHFFHVNGHRAERNWFPLVYYEKFSFRWKVHRLVIETNV